MPAESPGCAAVPVLWCYHLLILSPSSLPHGIGTDMLSHPGCAEALQEEWWCQKKLCSWVREQNERHRMPAEQREGGIQAPASPTTVILGSALFR